MKKFLLLIGILAGGMVGFILYCNFVIMHSAGERTYDTLGELPYRRVGLVLGTSKYLVGGGINKYYENRIEAAYEAYSEGKVDYLLVSGDNALMEYNEPMRMKKSLMEKGVPEERVYLDYAGFRTLDSVVRAREVFDVDEFTIISQKFQNERAVYIARSRGIEAIAYNAEDPGKGRVRRREMLARVKAVLDIEFLHTEPKFLGDKIYIGREED